MPVFNINDSMKTKIKQKTLTKYIELIPITSSDAVVIDNDNEIYLNDKIDDIDSHLNDTDIHFTIDNVMSELNKPVLITTNKTTSDSVSALSAVNNIIFMGSTNIVESFSSIGTIRRTGTTNMTGNTQVLAIAPVGDLSIITGKGNTLVETSYYLTASYKRMMFPDTNQYITAIATYNTGLTDIVVIGTNKGNVGIFRYKPGDSSAYLSNYAFTSTITTSLSQTDVTNKLFTVFNDGTSVDSILLTSDAIILGNSNSAKTAQRTVVYSYTISSTNNITISHNGSTASVVSGNFVNLDFSDNKNSFIIAYPNGSCTKYASLNVSVTSFSYNQQRTGVTCIDMVTDNDENIYLLYSDGLLRKINSSDEKLWDYQTLVPNSILGMSIDKNNNYIVVSDITGNFEVISYMTGKNLVKSVESSLMMLTAQVLPGDYIKKIEVCQLNGTISINGDVNGSVELNADNTCLIDPNNSDHISHKIEIQTTLADDIELPTASTIEMSENSTEKNVVNKKYVDDTVHNNVPIVLSKTKPDVLNTGGVWLQVIE